MSAADQSVKPYLVRAIYEWCADNNLTPHMTVRALPREGVPPNYADLATDGVVTFNISGEAVRNLLVNNEGAAFTARFGGVTREVRIAMEDVAAIFARETGHGLRFPEIAHYPAAGAPSQPARLSPSDAPPPPPPRPAPARKKPNFRVV